MWRWTSAFGSGHIRPRVTCTRRGLAVCGVPTDDFNMLGSSGYLHGSASSSSYSELFPFRDHNGIEQLIMLLILENRSRGS